MDWGSVVLVLDLPAEGLPWLTLHPAAKWVASDLRLGERPILWADRPTEWPVWNHQHRRLVRYWCERDGPDKSVIDALRSGRFDLLEIVEPSPAQLRGQLGEELPVSTRHLRAVLDNYWDPTWRRAHRGFDEYPEHHLWRAATAVLEITDASRSGT